MLRITGHNTMEVQGACYMTDGCGDMTSLQETIHQCCSMTSANGCHLLVAT